MNSFVLIKVISVLIAAFSQILLKMSANKEYENRVREYLNPLVIISYGIFFLSMILGTYSLKQMTISAAAIIESLSYILIPMLSYVFLKEKISGLQMFGIAVILLGIFIFNL